MLVKACHWVQHFAACATTVFVLKYMSNWQGSVCGKWAAIVNMTVFVAWFDFSIFGFVHNLKQTYGSVLKTVAYPGVRGDICSRAQHFEGVNWSWNVTQQLQNNKCQRMLVITIHKMSNASRWYKVAKSDQDQQSSQQEQLWTLVTF